MNEFGKRLRTCRKRGALTQERLGALLGEELGDRGFSGAAISDWERGASKIHADHRTVLTSLVLILRQHGGLHSLADANELLEAGNYRALDEHERELVFPGGSAVSTVPAESPSTPQPKAGMISIPMDELRLMVDKARLGPAPAWPRILIALLRRGVEHIHIDLLSSTVWVWTWLLTWALMAPSLRWPFADRETALAALVLYAAGSVIVPALIATRTNTRDHPFWQECGLANTRNTRLYTHQGASVGFHVGYFFIFFIGIIRHNLGIAPALWAEYLAVMLPLLLSQAGARLIPHNLLLAYKQLRLADGGIFFIFFLIGPAWAVFFLEYHSMLLQPIYGGLIVLFTATLLALQTAWKKQVLPFLTGKSKNKTTDERR